MQTLPVYKIENFEFYHSSFYARRLKDHIEKHGFIQHPHKHDFYLAVLFTQGTGTHEIDFTSYPVAKGAVFLMNPGQVHRWTLTDDTEGYIFFHTKEFYDITCANKRINDFTFFSSAGVSPFVLLNDEQLVQAEALFKRIFNQNQATDSIHKFETLGALCNLLYLDIEGVYSRKETVSKQSTLYLHKLNTLRQLIDLNYTLLKYPKDYAALMSISAKHLNRICIETVGKTTGDLISERLVLEAKRVLAYSDKPIKQIAEQLGFDDSAYFIRFFKKHTAQTPAKFQSGF
ncbi:MAG: helix-turn-helix domain-containing protein [Bacteroidetes bacterium]|nr:MAG: helix-turn-helix domain-containing protein [Bacteroidota bacterium]